LISIVAAAEVLALRYELGCLFAAISLDQLQAIILSLRIADSLGQHLAQLSLDLCGFALGWLPLGHEPQVGMPEANPSWHCPTRLIHVRFSNRPFGVKRFQTIHHCNVDVAHGLVLLFGIDARVLPAWDSRTRRNNLLGGLAVNRMAGPSGHANSPHPSSREGHLSTARWSSSFLLSGLILNGFHAAAAACSRVHRNSVPSTQMRCMITASRRARATIAFFIPRRLAICMAHALSHDHFFECIML
jgi:hypothetical protein